MISCAHCGRSLVSRAGGRTKLRVGKVVAFEGDLAETVCPHCKMDTPVPGLRLALPDEPKLVVRPPGVDTGEGMPLPSKPRPAR